MSLRSVSSELMYENGYGGPIDTDEAIFSSTLLWSIIYTIYEKKHRLSKNFGCVKFLGEGRSNPFTVHPPAAHSLFT